MLNIIVLLFVTALALSTATGATDGGSSGDEFLQCYANSALESKNNGKIICHAGSNFCIKEVVNATRRSDCGLGKHSNDVWDRKLGQCVYRKCSQACPSFEQDRLRDFNVTDDAFGSVRTFNRTSFCCDTNLCNAAMSKSCNFLITVTIVIVSIAFAVI